MSKKKERGRETILTKELADNICSVVADGNYFSTACEFCGTSEENGYNWKKWGEEGKDATGDWPDAYRYFFKSIKHAEAFAEVTAVASVRAAAQPRAKEEEMVPGQWQADMTFLERRFRDRWSRGEHREMTGNLEHTHKVVTAEQIRMALLREQDDD